MWGRELILLLLVAGGGGAPAVAPSGGDISDELMNRLMNLPTGPVNADDLRAELTLEPACSSPAWRETLAVYHQGVQHIYIITLQRRQNIKNAVKVVTR